MYKQDDLKFTCNHRKSDLSKQFGKRSGRFIGADFKTYKTIAIKAV